MEIRKPLAVIPPLLILGAAGILLAAILFPIFAQARGGSRFSCFSNLKQLELGMQMYQEDYDGRFPRAAEWMDATMPYEKNEWTYRCTSIERDHKTEFGYAFNSVLERRPLDKHKVPGSVVTVYDSSDLRWNANAPGRAGAANPPRHVGLDNFAFADGHVKAVKVGGTVSETEE